MFISKKDLQDRIEKLEAKISSHTNTIDTLSIKIKLAQYTQELTSEGYTISRTPPTGEAVICKYLDNNLELFEKYRGKYNPEDDTGVYVNRPYAWKLAGNKTKKK